VAKAGVGFATPYALTAAKSSGSKRNKEGGCTVNKKEVVLTKERETKRTWRYQEQVVGEEVFGYIYLNKTVLGNPVPDKVKVVIEAA